MNQYLDRFRQSLTLRTLYGLIALGCLLGVSLLGRLDAASTSAADTRAEADARLARHGGAIDENLWRERAANAQEELTFWQSTRWSAPTSGVVAAELQNAITQIARGAGLDVIAVNVDPAPTEIPSGLVLRFSFSTDSRNGDAVAKALAAFGAHEPIIVVDEMNAVFDDRNQGRFSASGYAPIILAEPSVGDG